MGWKSNLQTWRCTMYSLEKEKYDDGDVAREEVAGVLQCAKLLLHKQSPSLSPSQSCILSTPMSYQSVTNTWKSPPSICTSGLAIEQSVLRSEDCIFAHSLNSSGKPSMPSPLIRRSHPLRCGPQSSFAMNEFSLEKGDKQQEREEKSRNWRRRSLPNLFQPSKEVLTVSPTNSLSRSPAEGLSYVDAEMTGLDMDQEATSEITLDYSHDGTRRKTLVRKEFSGSDESSLASSSVLPNRKRLLDRPSIVKRLRTDSSFCFLMDADNDESISSAGELERFFDSMGLEEENSRQQASSRSLQIEVSDDAMESDGEEEDFESVSIVGCPAGKGATDLIPTVETDDDEPEVESNSPTPSRVRMDHALHPDSHSKKDVSSPVTVRDLDVTRPVPLVNAPFAPPKNPTDNVVLRNARIYKWLVNCRTAIQK